MNNYFFQEKPIILLTSSHFISLKIVLSIIAILLLKPSYKLMMNQLKPKISNSFNIFKITNFFLNELYVCLYIIIFIFRTYRVRASLDLKPIIQFISEIFLCREYTLLLLLISWLCVISFIFIGIIKGLKDKLDLELLKRHLVLYALANKERIRTYAKVINIFSIITNVGPMLYPEFDYNKSIGFYRLLLRLFVRYFSKLVVIELIIKPFDFFYELFYEFNYIQIAKVFFKIYLDIKKLLHFLLSPIFFSLLNSSIIVYDLYYNNLVLTKIFNFLPIYFIYLLWNKINKAIIEKNVILSISLHEIVHDLYYQQNDVKYLFLTSQHINIVKLFVREGLTYDDERFGCDVINLSTRLSI